MSRARRELGRVLHLARLALLLRQRLDVGHLAHERGDGGAELRRELLEGRVGVLDGVVQQRGHQDLDVGDAADGGEGGRDVDGVLDVGALIGALAALAAVLAGGEAGGGEDAGDVADGGLRSMGETGRECPASAK